MTDPPHKSDRGGGIHITGVSDFRLRDLSFSIDKTTGEVSTSMTRELRNDAFPHWLEVAEDSAEAAEHARIDAAAAPLDDGEAFSAAVEREFQASVVAVAAAAFALEAFYWSVREHAPETYVKASSADGRIFETLKRGFKMSGTSRSGCETTFVCCSEPATKPCTLRRPGESRPYIPLSTSECTRGS